MYTQELVTVPSPGERLIERGVASTEMTLVYHAHGTVADAEASLEYIAPDSVAFIEGYSTGPVDNDEQDDEGVDESTLPFEGLLRPFNDLRLMYGKDHPQYQQYKTLLIEAMDEVLAKYVPSNATDFTLHQAAQINGLIKKDCLVFYADHRDIQARSDEDRSEVDEYNRYFHELVQDADIDTAILAPIPGNMIGPALHGLMRVIKASTVKHTEREIQAVDRSMGIMGRLAGIDTDAAGMRRTERGKLAAYTMYGTGHARSLTDKFTDKGLDPEVVVVKPVPEYLYLDSVTEQGYTNYRRRIGHGALATLAYQLTHEFIAPALVADTYTHLEFLNTASHGERLGFYVQCARIQKSLSHGERGRAEEDYLALLRSFMPPNKLFMPPKTQTVHVA
jgi:hypothetical protein